MKDYSKTPLSIEDQINLLESRGLHIPDRERVRHYLSYISYYRVLVGKKLGRSVGIGQNDICIASIAKVSGAELISTDSDFDHFYRRVDNRS